MHLDRAYAHLLTGGEHAQLLPEPHFRAHRGPGDDGAVALDNESAVERQAEEAGWAAPLKTLELLRDRRAQIVEANSADRRNRNQRRTFEAGTVGEEFDFLAHVSQPF